MYYTSILNAQAFSIRQIRKFLDYFPTLDPETQRWRFEETINLCHYMKLDFWDIVYSHGKEDLCVKLLGIIKRIHGHC